MVVSDQIRPEIRSDQIWLFQIRSEDPIRPDLVVSRYDPKIRSDQIWSTRPPLIHIELCYLLLSFIMF